MRLRSHLVALVLVALVPVLGFAALVIRENARLQLAATERVMRQTAQAVAHTVDKELESAITAVEALAESDYLGASDLRPLYTLSRRVVKSQGWASILLFDRDGRMLMHTSTPLGTALPVTGRLEVFTRARDGRRATVSDLFDGVHNPRIVAVYVPIVREGEVRYVMTVALPVSTFSAVLRAQAFVRGSVATLEDRQHVVLARTRAEEGMIGRRVEDPTAGHEGWVRSHPRDGQDVYIAFATAPLSGWRIVITSPVASVEAPLRRALWQLLVGGAVAAALASALAFVFGRRIAGAVGSLVRIARAVERGQRAQPLRTGVTEVNALAEQLRAAADRARKREEEAAMREHQARAIGEVAHALNASPDLDAVLRTAVEAVHNLVQADSARIALVEEAGALVLRYSTQAATAMRPGFVIERGHGLGGLALATGRTVRTDDFLTDPRFRADRYISLARMDGIVSCMAVPIVTADGVVGVIYANNFGLRPFSALDEAALVTLADHTAVAMQKARLLDAEHAARSEAEAASQGKDELLAMLGHELRNPLAAIANATHVLGVPHAPAEATRRAREIIARQNAHLAHLVDDLLDVARVTSGKIVLTRHPLELAEAARRAVATLAASGRTERHHVSLNFEPVWADVDETRWEQVVTNLVGNALRFTPAGGTVDITLGPSDGEAVLCVRDSGMGIAPEMLPRVFDLFVQGARGLTGGQGGLGLGLTLVHRIIELHGGTVEAG